ncbi:MAG TPA: transglycosylase SLT domain-containing protein [Pyrinomonadaceae bacterium]
MKFSNAFFFLLTIILAGNLSAQTPAEKHQKILRLIETRDYPAAVAELEALKTAEKKIFELNNYDYLLARAAEKKGDFAAAMANYQAVVKRNSVLSEYALWHLSQLAGVSGNPMLERSFLLEISSFAPESLLSDAVKARILRSYFESRNYEFVIGSLSAAGVRSQFSKNNGQAAKDNSQARENLVLLGEAYLQSDKPAEAREVFTKLITNPENPAQPDDFALAATKGLDRIETGADFGKAVAPLPDAAHQQRAWIYQFNRDFADARLHYQAIIKNYPQSAGVPEALFQTGRGYAQEANFVEAINWFERVEEQFPEHWTARDALLQAASAYARVSKPKEAIKRYQKFIEKYGDADNIERAYLNIVDVLRDTGEENDALKWAAKTQEVFKGKLPEALALFAQLRIRIAGNDWQAALADAEKLLAFSDLGGTRVPGGTNRAEVLFLKGFALENLQKFPEAIAVYLSIPDGRGEYYGWRATERLRVLANTEKTSPFVRQKYEELTKNIEVRNPEAQRTAAQSAVRLLSDAENSDESVSANVTKKEILLGILRRVYEVLPDFQKVPQFKLLELGRKEVLREKRAAPATSYHQNLADELLFLGLYDEAAPELEKAEEEEKKTVGNADFNYTLAVFYKRGDMANRAVAFIEPLWRAVPSDYQIELIPREQAELLYPVPYADSLVRFAPERGVDARFVLSIMRQESRYRADVKSVAAARGLMQFISTTSNQIARELKKDNFRQDELYNPPTAILFGSQYLGNLFKLFPNEPAAVAASYNGGEDNVQRWILRAKADSADRYVPEIVFSQSKDYAYKVMANYRVYRTFYDENLRTK